MSQKTSTYVINNIRETLRKSDKNELTQEEVILVIQHLISICKRN
jgi:hypothetical protein